MTPENHTPESEENKANFSTEQPLAEHQTDMDTEASTPMAPEEKVESEIDAEKETTTSSEGTDEAFLDDTSGAADAESKEISAENSVPQADMDTQPSEEIPEEEKVLSEIDADKTSDEIYAGKSPEPFHDSRSAEEIVAEMEKIGNSPNAGESGKIFMELKSAVHAKIEQEAELKKVENESAEKTSETWEHPLTSKINALSNIFKEKHDAYLKEQEKEHAANLEQRKEIIEKLKNLYTNTEVGTNLFKAIREVKELWSSAGKVAKNEFKLLNNDYFHHLNQFYQMLDMNKEYLEQEYSHNLEKRQHIIQRAKELENEPAAQKALNELQYLHKLWKEEAEPVAEEFREKTWEEFREISNRIHGRKAELSANMEAEQNSNLEKKNSIIEEIKALATPAAEITHGYWQQAIKKVEELREEFLKSGSVPRKLSNQNWTDFKQTLRDFNTSKNDFYKNLKGNQVSNLDRKQQLIQTAKDNMNSEDWDTVVPLFKKLQEEWKNIGHVPRNQANRVWDEFREACNTFFDNYRKKSGAITNNWKENYKNKKVLLDELKTIGDEEGGLEKINDIRNRWNAIGKVPKDKMSTNTEFNKLLKEKLKIYHTEISPAEMPSDGQSTDKARKMKNQITDLENEISTLENNLGFFSNSSRENPLLKDTFDKIDEKKSQLEKMKKSLHDIIKGE